MELISYLLSTSYCLLLLLALWRIGIVPFFGLVFHSSLSKVPTAHWTCRFSGLWILYVRWMDVENRTLYELHKKKGPIVRLAPNELSVNSYEDGLKTIYGGGFEKHGFYERRFANYGVPNMFSTLESKPHSIRKRMLSHVFSKSYIYSSSTVLAGLKNVLHGRLLPILQDASKTGKAVEVLELNQAYGLDSYTSFQFGRKLGSNMLLNPEERKRYLKNFYGRRPWLFWVTEVPSLTNLLMKLGIPLLPKGLFEATKELEEWCLGVCDRAEDMLSSGVDIPGEDYPIVYAAQRSGIQKLDPSEKDRDGESIPMISNQKYPRRLEIASDIFDQQAASHETTGAALTYMYYELSRNPDIQRRLREEVLTLTPAIVFPVTDGTERDLPVAKELDVLPLLDSIVQETLRLFPPAPGSQPRITPSPSCTLAGIPSIPPGVRVSCAAHSLHCNPDVFPAPDEWHPWRWTDATPEELVQMRHWFWAWGSGSRMCIGSHFATLSMKMALAGIYTNFTSEIVDAEGIEQGEGFAAGPVGNKLVLRFRHV